MVLKILPLPRSSSPAKPWKREVALRWLLFSGKLEAMTVILTSPFLSFSSRTVPKMILAFGSTDSVITLAASWISNMVKSSPPAMEKSTPLAPLILISRSGEEMAARAASSARFSPEAAPMPMSAAPEFSRTERISAKSMLMMPGVVMRSEMPSTASLRILSQMAKAFLAVMFFSTVWRSRSLGMTIRASTACLSSSMPCSA